MLVILVEGAIYDIQRWELNEEPMWRMPKEAEQRASLVGTEISGREKRTWLCH